MMEENTFPIPDQFAHSIFSNHRIPFEESMTAFTQSGMVAEGTLRFNPSNNSCTITDFSIKQDRKNGEALVQYGKTSDEKPGEVTCLINHAHLEKKRGDVKNVDNFVTSIWGSVKPDIERKLSGEEIYTNAFSENEITSNKQNVIKERQSSENKSTVVKNISSTDGDDKRHQIDSPELTRNSTKDIHPDLSPEQDKSLSRSYEEAYQQSANCQSDNVRNITNIIRKIPSQEHNVAFKEGNTPGECLEGNKISYFTEIQPETPKGNQIIWNSDSSKQRVTLPLDGLVPCNDHLKDEGKTEPLFKTMVDETNKLNGFETLSSHDSLEGKENLESDENWDLKEFMDPFNQNFPDLQNDESLHENILLYGGNSRTKQLFETLILFADANGLEMKDSSPTGNCMFQSINDQLQINGDFRFDVCSLRHLAVKYLEDHPTDSEGTHLENFIDEQWTAYLARLAQPYEWGDHLVIKALCEFLQRNIIVINVKSDDNPSHHEFVPNSRDNLRNETLYLGHLGEFHYVSLRPKLWKQKWITAVSKNNRKVEKYVSPSHQDTLEIEKHLVSNLSDTDPVCGIPVPLLSFAMTQITAKSEICYFSVPSRLVPTQESHSIVTAGGYSDGTSVFIIHKDRVKQSEEYSHRFSHEFPFAILYDREVETICDGEHTPLRKGQVRAEIGRTHPGYCHLLFYGEEPILLTAQLVSINGTLGNPQRIIRGYLCPNWPVSAQEWLTRNSNWPTMEWRKEIANLGCMIAWRSHPHSEMPLYEWQFIFNDAENMLVNHCLTENQLYVYGLFKACLDYHTKRLNCRLGTVHIKSTFFYVCEEIKENTFDDSPGACFIYLAAALLRKLKKRNVPNYFIRENNMLDHFDEKNVENLIQVIEVIRRFPLQCLDVMMNERGYQRSEIIDIIEGSKAFFIKDRDTNMANCMMFFPMVIRQARKYALKRQYRKAFEKIKEARHLLVLAPPLENGKTVFVPSLDNLLTQTFDSFDGTTIDMMRKELQQSMEDTGYGFRKVKDLTYGIDVAGLGETPVPTYVAGNALEEAFLLNRFGIIQHNVYQNYENASIFYTAALDLLENERAKLELPDVSEGVDRKQTNLALVAEYDKQALACFKNLFKVRKFEKLKPRMTQLEEVCKRMRNTENVEFVMEAWERIGDISRGAEFYTLFLEHMKK